MFYIAIAVVVFLIAVGLAILNDKKPNKKGVK